MYSNEYMKNKFGSLKNFTYLCGVIKQQEI